MNPVDWLLDSDSAIRWQAMRDLKDASPEAIAAERARVSREGIGAAILASQERVVIETDAAPIDTIY